MKGMCRRVRRKGKKRWANKSQRREGVKRGESASERERDLVSTKETWAQCS